MQFWEVDALHGRAPFGWCWASLPAASSCKSKLGVQPGPPQTPPCEGSAEGHRMWGEGVESLKAKQRQEGCLLMPASEIGECTRWLILA